MILPCLTRLHWLSKTSLMIKLSSLLLSLCSVLDDNLNYKASILNRVQTVEFCQVPVTITVTTPITIAIINNVRGHCKTGRHLIVLWTRSIALFFTIAQGRQLVSPLLSNWGKKGPMKWSRVAHDLRCRRRILDQRALALRSGILILVLY